jgi:hypothetical protein
MDGHQNLAAARDQPRLLDQVRGVIRRLHYSIRTEQTTSIGSDGSSCSTVFSGSERFPHGLHDPSNAFPGP